MFRRKMEQSDAPLKERSVPSVRPVSVRGPPQVPPWPGIALCGRNRGIHFPDAAVLMQGNDIQGVYIRKNLLVKRILLGQKGRKAPQKFFFRVWFGQVRQRFTLSPVMIAKFRVGKVCGEIVFRGTWNGPELLFYARIYERIVGSMRGQRQRAIPQATAQENIHNTNETV